jgi:probable rRNA maturation factor
MTTLVDMMPPRRGGSLAVCLVSDRKMSELNRRFRGRSGSTDVLSFPSPGREPDGTVYIGDIVISVPTALRQARREHHRLGRELKLLALHGYLHLLGYDHEKDDGTMLRLQRRLERKLLPRRSVVR